MRAASTNSDRRACRSNGSSSTTRSRITTRLKACSSTVSAMSGRPHAQLFDQASSAAKSNTAARDKSHDRTEPPTSIPAGGIGAPNAAPIHRGFLVQHRRRLLHLRDIVGGADLLILLVCGVVADEGAIAACGVRI